jgi:hypothetical protein
VGSDDPDQHLVVLRATAVGFKALEQRQGFFKTQTDLSEIGQEFEKSKHARLQPQGGSNVGYGNQGLV